MNWKRMCDVILSATVAGFLYTFCVPVANAQNPQCPTRPAGDNTNACASTAFVQNAVSSHTPPVTIGEFVIGTGTLHDKMTLWGEQVMYLPNLASDPGTFTNLFIGTGGQSLAHTAGLEGRYNTTLGIRAGTNLTTASYNTLGGFETGENITTGSYITAWGEAACFGMVTGVGTTCLGWKAGLQATGNYGIFIGYQAAPVLVAGDNCIVIGQQSGGSMTTCNSSTILGSAQVGLPATLSNEIRISDGAGTLGFRSDSSRNTYLGDGAAQRSVYLYYSTATNNVGFNVDSGTNLTVFTGSPAATRQTWFATGGVMIGSATGGDQGAGTLNAASFFINGSQLSLGGTLQLPATAQGDLWYGSASGVVSALPKNTSATRYLSNTGTSNNPAWAQVDLTNGVTGALPGVNGGTGLSTAAVGDLIYASATTPTWARLADVAVGSVLISGGVSTAPAWSASPTLTTSLTVPLVIGGTGTTGTQLTLKTTTGVGTTDALAIVGGNNGATTFGTFTATKLDIPQTTASTSTTTGALTIAGGIGVAGAGFFGASSEINKTTAGAITYMTVRADGSATAATGAGFRLITDGGTFSFITYATGSATNTNITTPSGKLVYFDAPGTATGTSDRYIFRVTNSFTTAFALREDGVVRAPGNVTSTSTTTGTVVVTGGVGISENLYAGGYMSVGTKVRTAGSAPAPSACGTSPTISGSDLAGLVTTGTGTPTSCTITFNAAYAAEPYCVVRGKVQSQVTDYTVSSSAIVVTTTATNNVAIIYHCIARSAGWLLNRDLDPAANDNSPAFMEKAA